MLNSLKQWFKILALLVALVACGLQEPAPTTSGSTQTKALANALTGQYFDNMDFTGTSVTREDAVIDLNFGTAAPVAGIASTSYSVRWTGQIMPAFSETYTFYLTSSDGARLMVNGQVLVNDWVDGVSRVRSGTVALTANIKYDIRLEYYRNATNASTVKLEWQSTSRARQIVPTTNLFPTGYSVPDVIAILQANTTFKATNLVLSPDLTTVSSGTRGKAFQSVVENGISLIFGRIDLSGNVEYLLKYTQVLDTAKFYDLLLQTNIDIGKIGTLINPDGTLATTAQETLVKALAKVYLKYSIDTAQAVSAPRTNSRLVVDNLCKLLLPPPSGCASGNCTDLALAYREAVCTLIGGVGDAILGAALGGIGGPLLTKPAILWKVAGVVLGGSGISGAISTNVLGVISNSLFSRSAIEATWAAYLECIAGKRVVGNVPIPGCPPILDGPNPNPINIADDLGHEGFVAVRWGNKAPVGNGPLAYGFQLQGQGLGISVSLSDTSVSLLPPIIRSGTVAAGGSTTRYIWYKCSQIPSTWTGTFTLSHNAPNASSPVLVPVTILCEDVKLSGSASAKFFSSNPSWSIVPANLSISIQNLSRVSVAYTATLTGLSRVNIIGGATGSISANGSTQIKLEGLCPETFLPSGATAGTLDIRVGGVLKTNVPIRFVCVGVEHAAYVSVSGLDCGARASVRTSKPSPGLSYLVSGYSNLITVTGPCAGPSTASAEALVRGKGDADAHLFVPVEQWEMPCRNAEAVGGLPLSCRREQWANAKARIEAVGY